MIWYDMIWYDMIWYDMIWYDMIWYDMIWYDMIWYDIWYDMIDTMIYDMIYDTIRYDIWYVMICYYMVWYMIWYMIWYDMIRYMIYKIELTINQNSRAVISFHYYHFSMGRDSSVGTTIRYGLVCPGLNPCWIEYFRQTPDRPSGPPSSYKIGAGFPGIKSPGSGVITNFI